MKDIASALARLNELGRPDLAEPIQFLMGERDGLMKALTSAKTVIESKDKAYSLIQQRWDAMQAKASTVDSERACNEMLTAEVDELRSRVVELERERDQLALSLSATRAERDHAVRSAELWESEHRAGYEAMGVYKHLWLEGRAIMAICGYFSRMRGPDEWCCVSKDGFTKRRVGTRQLAEMHSREGWTITPLYAGSAPVPAEQMDNPNVMTRATAYARDIVTWLHRDHYADNTQFEPFDDLLGLLSQIDNMICGWKEQPAVQEVDVDAICNAYESGVGHRGRPTANVNPYREGTPEHEAYAIGARGEAAQAETKVADDVGSDEWSAVVRELMAVASYRPSCQKYIVAIQEAQKEHETLKRFAGSLLSIISEVSNALGISEDEQLASNGAAELLIAIEELKLSTDVNGICERIEEYGGHRENEGGSYATFQKSEAHRHRADADAVLGEIRAMLAAKAKGE